MQVCRLIFFCGIMAMYLNIFCGLGMPQEKEVWEPLSKIILNALIFLYLIPFETFPKPCFNQLNFFQNFSVCKKCSRLGQLFHRLTHQKHRMFNMCSEVVEGRKRSSPAYDTTKILNELLANDAWLEQVRKKTSYNKVWKNENL